MLSFAKNGAKFLLNSPYSKDEVWDQLPYRVQQQLIEKNIKFFVIDANEVAEKQECEVELIPLCKRVFQTFRSFARGRSHQTNQKSN
jgi:Pyruvate/2-oxoacid:ferredoxin oxidoreductase gamma subunit